MVTEKHVQHLCTVQPSETQKSLSKQNNKKKKTNSLFSLLHEYVLLFPLFWDSKKSNFPAFVSSLDLSWFLRSSDRKLGELEWKSWNLDHSWDFVVVLAFGCGFSVSFCGFLVLDFLVLFGFFWVLCEVFVYLFVVCVCFYWEEKRIPWWTTKSEQDDKIQATLGADFWGLFLGFQRGKGWRELDLTLYPGCQSQRFTVNPRGVDCILGGWVDPNCE